MLILFTTLVMGEQPASTRRIGKVKTALTTRQLPSEFTKGNLTLQFTSDGGFTLRRSTDGKWLLYPSDTSYISVSIDGNVYVQPHMSGVGTTLRFISRQDTPDGPIFTYEVPDLPVKIKVAFVLQTDWMFIRTEVINNDSRNHTVAVRYLLDTQLDENDGAPLFAPTVRDPITGEIVVTHEVTIPNPAFTTWQAFDDPITRTLTTVGTLTQRPVQIAFAHWPEAVDELWDYTTDPARQFFTPGFLKSPKSDSCVLIWFDNRTLLPAQATTFETAYGLRGALAPGVSDRERLIQGLKGLKEDIENAAKKWTSLSAKMWADTVNTLGENYVSGFLMALAQGLLSEGTIQSVDLIKRVLQ